MKLIKEHINFERGLDPKKAMGIGVITWDKVKEGDILINTKKIYPLFDKKALSFTPWNWMNSDKPIDVGRYFVITHLYRVEDYLELELAYTVQSLKHALLLRPDAMGLSPSVSYSLDGPISEWNSHFKIIQEDEIKVNEGFIRGLDPKEAMSTGIYSHLDEIRMFFRELWKYDNATPDEFPWNCFFLKEKNNSVVGLCYKFGTDKWYYAYFGDIKNIKLSIYKPDVIRFSKEYWYFLVKHGIGSGYELEGDRFDKIVAQD